MSTADTFRVVRLDKGKARFGVEFEGRIVAVEQYRKMAERRISQAVMYETLTGFESATLDHYRRCGVVWVPELNSYRAHLIQEVTA